ncbi:hypothetical protein DL96DRAFT_1816474 [Flagelloscypha sp. PMI_526]|nr:hypothetical protein DL96DRAFT_1816474 [Flagelloscypha sp. PMI_526]
MEFNDPKWLQILVTLLFTLDTSQTIVEFYGVWYFAVENYTNPLTSEIIWITIFCGVATITSTLTVQTFLINRFYQFTRQFWLSVFVVLVAIATSICALVDLIMAWLLRDFEKFAVLIPLNTAWLCIEASVDIVITVILSRALWKSKLGIRGTDTVINRSVRAAIQSGLFSSVFAVLVFLSFLFWPKTYLYAVFFWPLGRIYSNSLIYTLVARKELSKIASGTVEIRNTGSNSFPMTPIRFLRDTAADSDAIVANDNMKSCLDRDIVFSVSKDIARSH